MRTLSGKHLAENVVDHHIGDPTGDCDYQRIVLGVQDEGDIIVNPVFPSCRSFNFLYHCCYSDLQDVGLKLAPLLIWVVFAQVINLY